MRATAPAALLLISLATLADPPAELAGAPTLFLDPVPPGEMHADHVRKFIEAENFGMRRKISIEELLLHDVLWVEDVYRVSRAELVGLLVADDPRVYVEPIRDRGVVRGRHARRTVEKRTLDTFEARALRRLQAGESLVFEPAGDGLRGMGAIVAGPECRTCHAVEVGDLLGAFTYRLRVADDMRQVWLQAPVSPDR